MEKAGGLPQSTLSSRGCGPQYSSLPSTSSLPAPASWEMDLLGCWVVFPGLAPTQGLCACWTVARGGTLCTGENRLPVEARGPGGGAGLTSPVKETRPLGPPQKAGRTAPSHLQPEETFRIWDPNTKKAPTTQMISAALGDDKVLSQCWPLKVLLCILNHQKRSALTLLLLPGG